MDNSPALKLPVELWIKVALILRDASSRQYTFYMLNYDIEAVRPLSKSCRWLHAVIEPILYERIVVYADGESIEKIGSLVSTLSSRPDLRSSVRSLRLYYTQPEGPWEALFDILPLLVEIRLLSLTSVVIEEAIVRLLHNARQLRTLHIYDTRWGIDVPEKWSEGGSFGRSLTKLAVGDMDADPPHHIPKHLQLFVPTITELEISSKLIAELTKSPAFLSFGPSLLQLVTEANDPIYHPPLHQLLLRCPNIKDLDAEGLCLVSPIDDKYLPNLRIINADNSLVAALLPGRRIRSITTTAHPILFTNPLPWLEVLHLSDLSGQRSGLEMIDALWVACPGLIRLELQPMTNTRDYGPLAKRIETHLTSDAAALPRLRVLHLKPSFDDDDWAMEIETSLSEESEVEMIAEAKRQDCPDLCDVWLSPAHAWMYVPDDDAWILQARSLF